MLQHLLRRAADAAPDRPFVVTEHAVFTYGDVAARSYAWAKGLSARGIERFACVVTDPGTVITLLCAAAVIGAEACVYPSALDDAAIDELTNAFEHETVVTDRDLSLTAAATLAPGSLPTSGDDPLPTAAAAPVLILTTGTTGRPKGARHDWARLGARVRGREGSERERWLLAYNLNQFAGLQVLLYALAGGSTIVVPRSNQPRDALDAMRAHGVTHASATPTFWRFLLASVDETTVCALGLEQITLGGEAVPASVLSDLARVFPRARVSQVYASTEVGSSVSVRDGKHGLPISVLARGDDADVQFRIVDGELCARSRVGMLSYAGNDGDGEDGWRGTGDMVEVRGDRIHFVGRTSEIINVGGVKVHPLTVEEVVGAVQGVALAHVFGRRNPMTGEIVAVDIVADNGADHGAVEDAVRAACRSLPDAARPRRIRFVDAPAVRENKIHRAGDPG